MAKRRTSRKPFKAKRRFYGPYLYYVIIGGSAGRGLRAHSGTLGGPYRKKTAAMTARGKLERMFNRELARMAPDERPGRARVARVRNELARRSSKRRTSRRTSRR